MRLCYVLLVALFTITIACEAPQEEALDTSILETVAKKIDTSLVKKKLTKEETIGLGKPIWGYRFVLLGDFNGDHIQDTLVERHVNAKTKQETNKFFENLDIMAYQDGKIEDHEFYSYMVSNTLKDTFPFTSDLGVAYAETIGDIDGDGADEIGVVEFHADYSSVNTYRIYTYKDTWKLYYSFEIRDWEFPDLPEHNIRYGLFGAMGKVVVHDVDQNKALEEAIKNYQRVKIVAPNTIEYAAFDVGDCAMNYIYQAYEDSILWVVPEFPIKDKRIVSVWTEYEYYAADELEQIKTGKELLEICDPASLFRQRVQFKPAPNTHWVQ